MAAQKGSKRSLNCPEETTETTTRNSRQTRSASKKINYKEDNSDEDAKPQCGEDGDFTPTPLDSIAESDEDFQDLPPVSKRPKISAKRNESAAAGSDEDFLDLPASSKKAKKPAKRGEATKKPKKEAAVVSDSSNLVAKPLFKPASLHVKELDLSDDDSSDSCPEVKPDGPSSESQGTRHGFHLNYIRYTDC